MHELSVTNTIIEDLIKIAETNCATKIHSVTIVLGKMSGFDVNSLKFCYESSISNTILDGSKLIIEERDDKSFYIKEMEVD